MAYDYQPVCNGQVFPQAFAKCFPQGYQDMIQFVEDNWSPFAPYYDKFLFDLYWGAFNPAASDAEYTAFIQGWGFFAGLSPDGEYEVYYNLFQWPVLKWISSPCRTVVMKLGSCPQKAPPGMYP